MRRRCLNPTEKAYKYYGAKGVKIYEPWITDFELFLGDVGKRPIGKTLDRYPDNKGNYMPDNVRWATPIEQASNRPDNVYLTYNGKSFTVDEWARQIGLKRATIRKRLSLGWSVEKTLSTKLDNAKSHPGQAGTPIADPPTGGHLPVPEQKRLAA